MNNRLIIIGAGGHGQVIADIALKMGHWKDIKFLDDNRVGKTPLGISIIGKSSDVYKYIKEFDVFIGIGNNSIRGKIQKDLEAAGASIPSLIHPSAIIGENVEIGKGTVIMAGVIINCCTKIGEGCIVNTASSIDHDNCIGNYTHISPGVRLAGTVNVGDNTWLGVGSIVSNNVNITGDCIIGAGGVVVKDINMSGIYVGVPVRRTSK